MSIRLPAEWEEQDGVLLAWPHEASDWQPVLAEVEPVFTEIARQISRFERVVIVSPAEQPLREKLLRAGVNLENVLIYQIDSNDTWARDFGPITVLDEGEPLLLDFGFNGWGLKFAANLDNLITRRLWEQGAFRDILLQTEGLILEGGSIESDGRGTLLTTAECLLNANRNPHLTKEQIEEELGRLLGADRIIWLGNGWLAGDDTDSHIDTLARLCPDDTIAYVCCDDATDEHYMALSIMEKELTHMQTRTGRPFRLIPLPWPQACCDDDGRRLPATYANFLIINGAVLVPTYRDNNDQAALDAIRQAFPDREIIGIDCLPLITQHGSLHCVTMQIPKGVLA